MKVSIKKGLGFGLTSGVITTLGMMVGLSATTESDVAVIGGIVAIAIADAFSDAVGIHISEESREGHDVKEVWEATISTFVSKFVFAFSFIIPVLLFELELAVLVSVVWGIGLITVFSFYMAKHQDGEAYKVILEHVAIVVAVIMITHYVGRWVATFSS